MSPNLRAREELKFPQRWGFRRGNEYDSSSNDSKASLSGEPALKKRKLVSSLGSGENGEASEASDGGRFQQEGDYNPRTSAKIKSGKAKRGQRERSKKSHAAHNEVKKGLNREVNQRKRKSKTACHDHSSMDDLKDYMNSLIGDLKAARENLSTWMREEVQKLVAEELASQAKRREGSFMREKVQLEHQNDSEKDKQNISGDNMKARHQNSFDEHGKRQHQNKFKENVCLQETINFAEGVEVQHQKACQDNIQLQSGTTFRSHKRGQNSNVESARKSSKAKASEFSNNFCSPLESPVDYSEAIVPFTPTKKDGEERLALSAKSNSKSSPSDQHLQEQHEKGIVLGIRAQNCGESSEKSARVKNNTDCNSPHQSQEDQLNYGQTLGSMVSAEESKEERFGISFEPSSLSDSFGQVASSMYLTLPSVVKNHAMLHHRLDTSFNCIQPRVAGNQALANSETSSLLLGSSSQRSYFHAMHPEETSYGGINHFNQNSTLAPIVGSGFPVQLHQAASSGFSILSQVGTENLPRDYSSTLGLRMNGGVMRLSRGSYTLPEQYSSNNYHIHPTYKADKRLMAPQDGYQFPK